jgi:hypothetical protein
VSRGARAVQILVATAADFAVLRGGRPVAGGRWEDVAEVRAAGAAGTVTLTLRLRGGGTVAASDDAPGWDELLDAAESALPGIPRRAAWEPDVAGGGARVLFTRGTPPCSW